MMSYLRSSKLLHLLLASVLIGSFAACEADDSTAASLGVKLVQNAAASGLPTVAEFGAATCTSCKEMKIVLDRVAQLTQGKAHVLIIDISKDRAAGNAYGIQYMPTQVFFDAQGHEIGRHIGKLTEAEVLEGLGLKGGA